MPTDGTAPVQLTVRTEGRSHPDIGEQILVAVDFTALHLFDAVSGQRL